MALNDRQLQALKTRVHQQAQALADSEALAMQNMQYAADLEQQLSSCREQLTACEATTAELESLQAEFADCAQQLQQFEILEAQSKQLGTERDLLKLELDTAQQRCQQLEQSASKVAKLQSVAAGLKGERDELASKLEQAKVSVTEARSQVGDLQDLKQQRSELEARVQQLTGERDALAQQLEQVPTEGDSPIQGGSEEFAAQLKEAQRRQEVAEAHHYVLKRQYESLQERVKELEQECAHAHAHAQDCDKEVAEAEKTKLELQDRVEQLQARMQSLQAYADNLQQLGSPPSSPSEDLSQLEHTKQVLQQELTALRAENQTLQTQLEQQQSSASHTLSSNTPDPISAELEPPPEQGQESPLEVDDPPIADRNEEIANEAIAQSSTTLPSIPPLELSVRQAVGEIERKFDRRVLNLAAASAESVTASYTTKYREVQLPAFVRGR